MCTEAKLQNKNPKFVDLPVSHNMGFSAVSLLEIILLVLAVGDTTRHPLAHCEFPGQWLALTQYVLIPGCNIMPFCWMPPVSPYSRWKYWQPRHTCPIFKTCLEVWQRVLWARWRWFVSHWDLSVFQCFTLISPNDLFHYTFTQNKKKPLLS